LLDISESVLEFSITGLVTAVAGAVLPMGIMNLIRCARLR